MSVSAEIVVVGIVIALLAIAVAAMAIRLGVVERRIGRQEEASKKVDHDLSGLRMAVVGLATKESVSAIQVALGEMKGEVRAVGISAETMNHKLERIENYLTEAAAKRLAGVNERDGR